MSRFPQTTFRDNLKVRHDFRLVNIDTDAISIAKSDMSPFTAQERLDYLKELNSQYPELIEFTDDGYFDTVIVIASKNYVMFKPNEEDPKKRLKIKGASLKATNKEVYLKEFINQVINILLDPNYYQDQIIDLYNKTARECLDLKDMSRHSKKKTITESVLKGEGTAELRTRLALKGVNYQQGDKFKFFYLENENMCLDTNFTGDYCKKTLLEKLYKTMKIFNAIVPITLFKNYALQVNYYPLIGQEKPKRAQKKKVLVKSNNI